MIQPQVSRARIVLLEHGLEVRESVYIISESRFVINILFFCLPRYMDFPENFSQKYFRQTGQPNCNHDSSNFHQLEDGRLTLRDHIPFGHAYVTRT